MKKLQKIIIFHGRIIKDKVYKTIFLKRQSDILNIIFRHNIIPQNSVVLIPSYICSEVINNFKSGNINLSFYDREDTYKEISKLIADAKKQNPKKIFLYCYHYYSNLNKLNELLTKTKSLKINIIMDLAHIVNCDFEKINSLMPLYSFKNSILISSPRKYLKLSQGGCCKINKNYLKIKNNNYDWYSIFFDNFKSSYLIRTLITALISVRVKNKVYNPVDIKNKTVRSASIGHQICFRIFKCINKNKKNSYYKRYINLFKKFITQGNKITENNLTYWIIPLNKNNKKIKMLTKYFEERLDNPLMNWPDYHENLTNKDKLIFDNNIYFRIDKNTCNSHMYKKISSILKEC